MSVASFNESRVAGLDCFLLRLAPRLKSLAGEVRLADSPHMGLVLERNAAKNLLYLLHEKPICHKSHLNATEC